MATTVRLEHIGIRTAPETFDATLAFYCNLFGWRVLRELPPSKPGERMTFIGDGHGGALEVITADGPGIAFPTHLAFAVPQAEFDALAARLEAAGVAVEMRRQNTVGDELAFCDDPAGNRVQIVGRVVPLPLDAS
jgi:catechol 2,3-dioxygenase-like lactoylglutathione lyase family enzyme